jgi:hypothetical protein
MPVLRITIVIAWIGVCTALGQTMERQIPDSCPVTKPTSARFTPPESYRRPEAWGDSGTWYGTSRLWTSLPPDGHWRTTNRFLPTSVFREKLFWWREGYDPRREPKPKLIVTAEQLDGTHEKLELDNATNAIRADVPAMLVLIDVPTAGCWKITGRYADSELTYVVWVGPAFQ